MSIKTEIENYLIQSYQLNYSDEIIFHPVKVVQSVKSLIGINPENPNNELLNFIPKYLNPFTKLDSQKDDIVQVEYFASMINLEILLKKKKYSEAKSEILRLLQVSTGEPILELIILVHLQNINILPLLNSVYRTVKFCNGKDVKIAILFMINVLAENKSKNKDLSELELLDYITQIIEIQNTQFMRNVEFIDELQKLDYQFIYSKFDSNINSNLGEKFIQNGREEILEIVNKNSTLSLNGKIVFLLDSIRTLLRYRKSNENDNLIYYASNILEKSIG